MVMVECGVDIVVMEVFSYVLVLGWVDGIWFVVGVFINFFCDYLDFYFSMVDYFEVKVLLFDLDLVLCVCIVVVCIDDDVGCVMVVWVVDVIIVSVVDWFVYWCVMDVVFMDVGG